MPGLPRNPFTTLTTRNPDGTFTTANVRTRDSLLQGGLAIGGPIQRDRLFGFFTFDYYGRNYPGVATASNPAKLFATQNAQTIQTLATRLNVLPAQALASYNTVLTGLNSLLGDVPRNAEQTIFFPKLDWQLNERNHLTVQYNRMRWNALNGVPDLALSQLRRSQLRQQHRQGRRHHRPMGVLPDPQPAQ